MDATLANDSFLAKKRVLVTGASGFMGSHLVERLTCAGTRIAALARSSIGKLAEIDAQHTFSFFLCDLLDAEETKEVVKSFAPEIVFHFAAHPDGRESFEQTHAAIQGNLIATLNILEAFRLCGGELFIYGDSCKVYGNSAVPYREAMPMKPESSYAIAKAGGWELCDFYRQLHGIATVSIRPTLIYGPRQSYNLISYVVDCVLAHKREVRLDGGSQTRDPLYIDDAIDALLATARLGQRVSGRVVNIGGGTEISVSALASMVIELMGSRIPVVPLPERARPTEMWRSYTDNLEAQAILRWRPRTELRNGLEQTLKYLTGGRPQALAVTS